MNVDHVFLVAEHHSFSCFFSPVEIVQKQVTPVSPSPLPTEAVVSAHRHSQSLSDVGSTATQAASTPASFISSDKMSTPDRPRPPPNSVAPSPLPRRKNPGGKNGLCTATPAVSKSMEAICTTDRSRLPLPHVRNRSSSSRTQLDADFVAPFSPPLLSPRPHLSSGEPPLHDRSQSMETLQHHKMHREGDALSPSGKCLGIVAIDLFVATAVAVTIQYLTLAQTLHITYCVLPRSILLTNTLCNTYCLSHYI